MKVKNTRVIQLRQKSSMLVIGVAATTALATATASWLWLNSGDQSYWAVAEPATVGANLDEIALVQVSADFGLAKSTYLVAAQKPAGFLTEPLQAGQLLQESFISQTEVGEYSQLVVPVSATLSAKLKPGSKVQIWIASKFGSEYTPADLLIESAVMVGRVSSDSVFRSDATEVEVQIPGEKTEAILDAIASESAIYLVPSS